MVEDAPLTDLIRRAQNGDRHALKSVFDVTYDELHLDVTERTVRRDWEKARLLLAETLG